METIKLGQRVKDRVTGFVGIAVARCEYFNGCIQFHVSPPVDKDGNERKDQWVDEAQLEFVDHGILPEPKPKPELKSEKETPISTPRRRGRGGGFRSHPD